MKKFAVALSTAVLTVALPFAAQADQTTPGTPGDANCVGLTTAIVAQLGKTLDIDGVRGVGGLSHFDGLTVKEINAIVEAYCAGTL